MLKVLRERLAQGHQTAAYPAAPPALPERFRGRPALAPEKCRPDCTACADACPTDAIFAGPPAAEASAIALDLGRCLFCTDCTDACPEGAITFTREHRLASSSRDALLVRPGDEGDPGARVRALEGHMLRLFGRALRLRVVSAAGCNGCEAELNVLSTVVFDLGRFGIQIVASPRHADGVVVTGPVSDNMKLALRKTYDAVPAPKLVIAVGACAISGGPFVSHPEVHNGAASMLPVDLFIPGCPPHPYTTLDALLRMLAQLPR